MFRRKKLTIIGLMSGTSLDGVDLVCVQFCDDDSFEIIAKTTCEYSGYWLSRLLDVSELKKGVKLLEDLDVELGEYYSEVILDFIRENKIQSVDLIASHGHTVHHQPNEGYTLQIGCGEKIFEKTSIKTIYDFRRQDVLFGGQGAPLVPVGDELLFSEYDYCLNLGGFSNVSYSDKGVRRAYDICPVNTVLNFYASRLGFQYDDKGLLARSGELNFELFYELNAISFYDKESPKSLGVEFVKNVVIPILKKYSLQEKDVLRTFTEHIAFQISKKIAKGSVLVTGGGVYNDFLIEKIKKYNTKLVVVVPSKDLIEYKEALIFAFLGKLKFEGRVNCLSSVTGALKDHSSGVLIESL